MLDHSDVGLRVSFPVGGGRPRGVEQQHFLPQLLGNPERLDRAEPRDALAPVGFFGAAGGVAIARDKLADPAGNHLVIVRASLASRFEGP